MKIQVRVSLDMEIAQLFEFLRSQNFLRVNCNPKFWFSEWRIRYQGDYAGANATLRSLAVHDGSVLRFEPKDNGIDSFAKFATLYGCPMADDVKEDTPACMRATFEGFTVHEI